MPESITSAVERRYLSRRPVVAVFFLLFFGLGLLIYRSYGISWDEPVDRNTGMVNLKYVAELVAPQWAAQDSVLNSYKTPLMQHNDRDYGTAFQLPVAFLERVFKLNVERDIFLFRHLLTFIVCFGGVIAFFKLVERRFSDWRIGLFGALWLILSPRLFGDFFYNGKDAVFLAVFVVATNTAVAFLMRPTLKRAAWHALACALAIDVRIMGIIIPAATLGILLVKAVKGEVRWRQAGPALALYLGLTCALIIAFWPFLWPAPWEHFRLAFENMSKFRWTGYVLYRGELILSTDLPWHYAPVWVGITTPLLYLACFVVGVGGILRQLVRRHWHLWQGDKEWQDLLFLALFVGPIAAIIILQSVLYDGWRQLYFVYPAFLLVALRGWMLLWHWRSAGASTRWKGVVCAATLIALIHIAVVMIRAYPLQNVYFNSLAGRNVKEQFEVDYWGLSNLRSLQFVANHDSRPIIKVYPASSTPVAFSALMLKERDRARIQVVDNEAEADYIISNYRSHPEGYEYVNEIYRSEVGGEVINSVFKKGW